MDLFEKIESYGFECEGGPLENCVDWQALRAENEALKARVRVAESKQLCLDAHVDAWAERTKAAEQRVRELEEELRNSTTRLKAIWHNRGSLGAGASSQGGQAMKNYRKKQLQPMEPWTADTDMTGVSVSQPDQLNGSPKEGDMIAMNPQNPEDKWLVAADFFAANYESVDG